MDTNGRRVQVKLIAVVGTALILLLSCQLVGLYPSLYFYLASSSPHLIAVQEAERPSADMSINSGEEGIWIHIEGAISDPGIYRLEKQAVLADAIAAAGGLTASAHEVNLSETLNHGEEIYIPTVSCDDNAERHYQQIININESCIDQLQKLTGIGPVLAERIVNRRQKIDGFERVEDLLDVRGIGPATLEDIKPHITLH